MELLKLEKHVTMEILLLETDVQLHAKPQLSVTMGLITLIQKILELTALLVQLIQVVFQMGTEVVEHAIQLIMMKLI